MTTRPRSQRRRIEREAEGYLELGMPRQALQTLDRLGDPAAFGAGAPFSVGRSVAVAAAVFRGRRAVGTGGQNVARRGGRSRRLGLVLQADQPTGSGDRNARNRALIVKPDEAILRYNLACYLSLAGHKRRALRHLSQALAMDPVYRAMVETESDFDPIRDDPEFQAPAAGAK